MDHSLFPRDLFGELDRLQRQMQQAFEFSPSIRGFTRGGFPALNIGTTAGSAEIYAFAPGLDPATIEVTLERGVLSISGDRKTEAPNWDAKASVHINERFAGRFHRVVTLTDDLDPNAVGASYRDGVLSISIKRSAQAQPRRVAIN
jgi:HSP20 family protein